jgi:hypothetical protein
MAGSGRPPVRREDDIVRDLHAERERFVAVLEDLGDDIRSAAESARLRAREAARKAAPAALATAALLLATMLVRRRRRDGRR